MKKLDFFLVVASVSAGIATILAFDFFFGNQLMPNFSYQTIDKVPDGSYNRSLNDKGFYEPRPNLNGYIKYGSITYRVMTDSNGFRISDESAIFPSSFNMVLIGDSFIWGSGLSWDETLAGQLQEDTALNVLNAGVESYSPTTYTHRFNVLSSLYKIQKGSPVIVAVDISDLQDESSRWFKDSDSVIYNRGINWDPPLKLKIIQAFPLLYNTYSVLKPTLFPWLSARECSQNLNCIVANDRSAFTYKSPTQLYDSYLPLGVEKGSKKLERELSKLLKKINEHGYKSYILSYPWPAQIVKTSQYFDWDSFLSRVCETTNCHGVISTTSTFKNMANVDLEWYNKFYIKRDTHFNKQGYKILADEIRSELKESR